LGGERQGRDEVVAGNKMARAMAIVRDETGGDNVAVASV